MDPPQRKHPKSAPSATAEFHPDPTFASHTIQTMSNHFATLYTTHKLLASSNGSNGVPQSKSMDFSGGSTTGLTKSNHQRRRIVKEMEKKRTIATKSAVQTKEIAQNGTKTAFFRDQKTNQSKKDTNFKNDFQRQDSELKKTHQGWEVRRPEAMDGGARKSICSFEAELSDFLKRSGARVMTTDMPPFMQAHAVECARKAYNSLEKFTSKALAFTLKKEFDGVYGPAWHCIVGTGFGSFVTHSVGGFLYFSMDRKMYVLLFKTTVQRADST